MAIANNNRLIIGNNKGDLEVYDVHDLSLTQHIHAHDTWIREIRMDESTAHFTTVSDDKKLKTWKSELVNRSTLNTYGSWLTCVDYIAFENNYITATGKLNGSIHITHKYGTYHTKSNASINKIALLKEELPSITIVVATHGGGIQLWSAREMKISRP